MLTESQLKKLKPRDEAYQVACGDGLSLFIEPNGKKYWKYRFSDSNAKRKTKRLGSFSDLSLRDAKNERIKILAELKSDLGENKAVTFEKVAHEWFQFKKQNSLGDKPLSGVLELADKFIKRELVPQFGHQEFRKIKRTDLVKLVRNIESRGVKEPCRKACSYLNQIYDYCVSVGYIDFNIASNLNKVLVKSKIKKNYAYLNSRDIIHFYSGIHQSNSHPIVKKAIQIKLLTGVRSAELIHAKKENIDLENGLWNIPAIQVKQFRRKVIEGHKIPDYVVPLSKQAIDVMRSAMQWSHGSNYVFNSPLLDNKPIHFNTINRSIRLMGYSKDDLTSHGFRSSMSTILNESDLFKSEWIEAQLSHTDKNTIRGTYNHANYLKQRSEMMQWWADYLSGTVQINA